MPVNDDKALDRLLARGRVRGPRRDAVIEQVLGARRAARRRRVLWWGAPLLAAAAALVLYLRPHEAFHARGDGSGPLITVSCANGDATRCPSGATLVFRVDGAAAGGRLWAWAERLDGGVPIAYFSSGGPRLTAQAGPQIVREGVRLGVEQPPGEYQIRALIAETPDHDRAPVIARMTVTP